jgi:hypothetical protein
MANYESFQRSNYFSVKDPEAFKELCQKVGLTFEERQSDVVENPPLFAIFYDQEGGWPTEYYDEERGDGIDFEIVPEIAAHLAEGEVCILMEIGREGRRYAVGEAIAFNADEDTEYVSLRSIYNLAKGLTNRPDDITLAER